MFGTGMRKKCVVTSVDGRTKRTGIVSGIMHVIVISHVGHDLTAQWAAPPVIQVTLSLKYLWYPPIFQVCNNRNHSQQEQSPTWLGTYASACGICFSNIQKSLLFFYFLTLQFWTLNFWLSNFLLQQFCTN